MSTLSHKNWQQEAMSARTSQENTPMLQYIDDLPVCLSKMQSLIVYGPSGSGKYTQAMQIIAGFSPSGLANERRLHVSDGTKGSIFTLPMSDIHFEVDMAMSSYNTTESWGSVFSRIHDTLLVRKRKQGIILCTSFEKTHPDLLKIFFSYLQRQSDSVVTIRFILLTSQFARLPKKLRCRCRIIPVTRSLSGEQSSRTAIQCSEAGVDAIQHVETEKDILKIRDAIYGVLTRNLDIGEWIFKVTEKILEQHDNDPEIEEKGVHAIQQYYHDSRTCYRPIYHLERLSMALASIKHGLATSEGSSSSV